MKKFEDIYTNVTGTFPNTLARDVTAPAAGDGTEYLSLGRMNEIWGPLQALLTVADITPSGNVDTTTASDFVDAIEQLYQKKRIFHAQEQQTAGTSSNSGASPTGVTRRDLVEVTDTLGIDGGGGGSIGSSSGTLNDQIILPAGTYYCRINSEFVYVTAAQPIDHTLNLYNVTGSALLVAGRSQQSYQLGTTLLEGQFTITVQSTLEIRHFSNGACNGGEPNSLGLGDEIYTEAYFEQIARP